MRIVLVRHGQTAANTAGALDTVCPGLPLTAEGREQAERLAARWESEVCGPPDVIAVSGLTRTRQTAAPLAREYGLVPVVHPGIRELRSGDVEMASDVCSQITYVRTVLRWCAGDLAARMPGGESGREALARSVGAVHSIALGARAEHGPGAVVVFVVHGGLTRLLSTALADNLDETLVNMHFVGNRAPSSWSGPRTSPPRRPTTWWAGSTPSPGTTGRWGSGPRSQRRDHCPGPVRRAGAGVVAVAARVPDR